MKKLFFKYWKYLVAFILILIIFVINLNYNEDDSYENISEIQEINESDEEEKNTKFVEIKGEVRNPGVYEVGDVRIIDVVKLAGGFTDEVDTSLINLSKKVTDKDVSGEAFKWFIGCIVFKSSQPGKKPFSYCIPSKAIA